MGLGTLSSCFPDIFRFRRFSRLSRFQLRTRRAMHDSHRLLADHNGRAVHDRSRYRHGSSRSECLPQSATSFSLFISFRHFSRPSCPVRLRRSTSSGKLDFLGDEFPVSSSTALCPLCFFLFRAHLFFHCGCERCYHCLQSCGSCHHFGDGGLARARQGLLRRVPSLWVLKEGQSS